MRHRRAITLCLAVGVLSCLLSVAKVICLLMLSKKMMVVCLLFCFLPLLSGSYMAKQTESSWPPLSWQVLWRSLQTFLSSPKMENSTFRQPVFNYTCYGKVPSLFFLQGELLNLCLFWLFQVSRVLLSDNFIFLHWWNLGQKNIWAVVYKVSES